MRMKVQGSLMQVRLVEIHQVFAKQNVRYFSNRAVYLTSAAATSRGWTTTYGHTSSPCGTPEKAEETWDDNGREADQLKRLAGDQWSRSAKDKSVVERTWEKKTLTL